MNDAILVLNGGSASLRFSVYRVGEQDDLALALRGVVENLGGQPHFQAKDRKGHVLADARPAVPPPGPFGHAEAFAFALKWVREHFGAGRGGLRPVAVGHRVVHGGLDFIEPAVVDDDVIDRLDRLVPLAPLHQPHDLAVIRAVRRLRPDLPQVACFDTAFHHGRAAVTEQYGLPDELFHRGVRRWGFHGLSCASIVGQLDRVAPDLAAGRLIVAHLGNGASLSAVRGGRSVDTTTGFSILEGLPTGTRCGSLDPGVVLHLLRTRDVRDVERLLYAESGLLGISGVSGDVRELLASRQPGAGRAIDYLVYRVAREAGSLATSLGGFDALVFTGGVGENAPVVRRRVCEMLGWLGVAVDPAANDRGRGCVSPAGRFPAVWVLPSDEEQVIAAGTLAATRHAAVAS